MPEDLLEDDDNEPKNINFAQVYPAGWDRLLNMPTSNPQATRLYALLAKHAAPMGGAVCASYATIAECLGVSVMTARRAAEYLVENEIVVRFRAGTGAFIYALDPEEVWKSAAKYKKYAAFHTRSLVARRDTEALEAYVKFLRSKDEEEPRKAAKKKAAPTKRVRKDAAVKEPTIANDAFEDYLAEAIAAE